MALNAEFIVIALEVSILVTSIILEQPLAKLTKVVLLPHPPGRYNIEEQPENVLCPVVIEPVGIPTGGSGSNVHAKNMPVVTSGLAPQAISNTTSE